MQHFGFLGGWLSLEGKKRNTQAGRYELGSVSSASLPSDCWDSRHVPPHKKERRASFLGTAEAELIVLVQLINFL